MCAAHQAALTDQNRSRTLAAWKRDWPPARRAAFDRLYASMVAYADAAHALDCHGGTAAVQCSIDGMEQDLTRFAQKLGALLGHNSPPAVPAFDNRANAATDADGGHRMMKDTPDTERGLYAESGRKTIAVRARFEADLPAFAATLPGTTPHRTRALFADL